MSVTSVRCCCGVALQGQPGQAYNEEAFRYLLDTERRRAERSSRAILLLLVSVKKQPLTRDHIPGAVAPNIFCGLWASVREVDFIGWFREDRIAGVILTQGAQPLLPDVPSRIGQRTAHVLLQHVPSTVADRLHVRVLQLRAAKRRRTP